LRGDERERQKRGYRHEQRHLHLHGTPSDLCDASMEVYSRKNVQRIRQCEDMCSTGTLACALLYAVADS
jgi:hypothetical protein